MIKLTKAQRKDLDRIEAHLKGQPFKENARAKPAVPDLALDYVLDRWIPDNISDLGAFHTPTSMAMYIMEQFNYVLENGSQFDTILDPCAGTGNLIYPYYQESQITAVELQMGSVMVGKTVMPEMEWVEADAFDWAKRDTRLFDLVILNPPFGIQAGMYDAESYTGFKVKSQHQFFALAINKCKPGGHIAVVAPWNFTDWPKHKGYFLWQENRVGCISRIKQLPGEFLYTKIAVDLFIFKRKEEESIPARVIEEPAPLPKVTQVQQLRLWS